MRRICSFLVLCLLSGLVTVVSQTAAEAHQSPANCAVNAATLAIAQTPVSQTQGGQVHYRVTLRNNTNIDPQACDVDNADLTITHPAANGTPSGTTHTLATNLSLPASGAGDVCFRSASALACPAGTTETISANLTYTVAVNPGVTTAVAEARAFGDGPTTTGCPNGSASAHLGTVDSAYCDTKGSTTNVVRPNLTIAKTPDNPGDTNPAGTIDATEDGVFKITVTNNGAGDALGVTIDDTLPTGTGFPGPWTEVTDLTECTITGGNVLQCNVGTLTPNQSFSVSVKVATTGDICPANQAFVNITNGTGTGPNDGGAKGDATNFDPPVFDPGQIRVNCPALEVEKDPDVASDVNPTHTIDAGDDAVFRFTVTNHGPGTAKGVTLNDDLPFADTLNWTIVGAPVAGCQLQNDSDAPPNPDGHLFCNIGDMPEAPAAGSVFTVSVQASNTYDVCLITNTVGNSVTVNNPDATADGSNTAPDTDSGQIVINCPRITVEKTPDAPGDVGGTVTSGQDGVFTFTVTNNGPGQAEGVELNDDLPNAAVLDWELVPPGTDCTLSAADHLNCLIGDMAANETFTVQVRATNTEVLCTTPGVNVTIDNPDATASATNAPNDTDDGHILVLCPEPPSGAVFLIIDEDSIDNDYQFVEDPANPGQNIFPNTKRKFTKKEVNDDKPGKRQRDVLRYWRDNPGRIISLQTGRTNDEGWFAPNCIPEKWLSGTSKEDNDCLTGDAQDLAIANFVGDLDNSFVDQERLDKIPDVRPLRALGLKEKIGETICAIVYDSDIGINYDHGKPLGVNGNLQGETLGTAAFEVLDVDKMNFFSSSTLPEVKIRILDADENCPPTELNDAPIPDTSSEPNDIDPANPPAKGYRNRDAQGNPI